MKQWISVVVVSVFALIILLPATAQQPPKYLNVKDFGAVGDGKVDDTGALQKAFDDAVTGNNPTRHVWLPAGNYRITKPLAFSRQHKDLHIEGAGNSQLGFIAPTTCLTWDGEKGGTMLNIPSVFGLRLSDFALDGGNKAGVLIKVNSIMGFPSALFYVERILLRNAHTGFETGSDEPKICASDMTLVDLDMTNLTYGFHSRAGQNVNFVFIRPVVGRVDIGLYFEHGGSVTCTLLAGAEVGTAVKIDNGMKNTGNSYFNGFKIEPYVYKGKRTTLFDVNGDSAVVKVSSMNSSVIHVERDNENPLFILRGSSQMLVDSSLIWSQKIAKITGTPESPSLLQFINCRFGYSDPRLGSIEHDENSGYVLRDCIFDGGVIRDYRADPRQTMPDPITKLTAANPSANTVLLTWTAASGALGYSVEMSADGKTDWKEIGVADAKVTTFKHTGLTPGTTYYYRVRPYNGAVKSNSVPISVTTSKTK